MPVSVVDFQRVALIGPGLLGGSMGLALRALENAPEVRAWARRQETVDLLQKTGCVDSASTDLSAIVEGADLIVLATPVGAMEALAKRIVECPGLAADAVVTDVGSVKQCVVEVVEPVFVDNGRGKFVGSHPMAGSEQAGVAAARGDLFEGAMCLLTPTVNTDGEALAAVDRLWRILGMSTHRLAADEHDQVVARISHLPHLTAAALVMAVVDENASNAELAGPGFRDSTRIASGPPEMWTEILLENRVAVSCELRRLQQQLGETLAFLDKVNDEELRHFLAEAKRRRDLFGVSLSPVQDAKGGAD
jgi:prephenate dehydrogenase